MRKAGIPEMLKLRRRRIAQEANASLFPDTRSRSFSQILGLLPNEFREQFGAEMEAFQQDGSNDRRSRGSSIRWFKFKEIWALTLFVGKRRILGLNFRRRKTRTP